MEDQEQNREFGEGVNYLVSEYVGQLCKDSVPCLNTMQ